MEPNNSDKNIKIHKKIDKEDESRAKKEDEKLNIRSNNLLLFIKLG